MGWHCQAARGQLALIVAEFIPPQLRVKALQPRRFRAGLEFTSAASDLTVEMLGTGFAAIMALAAILADPLLSVTVIDGDAERPVTDEERDQLTAFLEAEGARVDPAMPPNDLTAEAVADAAVNLDQLNAEQAEKDRLAAEAAEATRLAAEQAEKDRLAAEAVAKAAEPKTSSKPSGRKPRA